LRIFLLKEVGRNFLVKDVGVRVEGVAVDRHTMLLIGSAIVAVLIIASVMLGAGGIFLPR